MHRTPWSVVAAWLVLGALPSLGKAQSVAYLRSLATPPQTVGTCGEGPPPILLAAGAPVGDLVGRQLELTVAGNAARRTLIAYTDRHGQLRQYSEMSGPLANVSSGTSAEVEATVDRTGNVRGVLLRHTTTGHGLVRHTRRALSSAERRTVRVLAEWLLERCRA